MDKTYTVEDYLTDVFKKHADIERYNRKINDMPMTQNIGEMLKIKDDVVDNN